MNKYRIYPSLLDSFQRLLDSDLQVEEYWNIDGEGNYKKSADELYTENEQSLLDSINRVPHEPIEAADKGTCFNEIVDCMINGTCSQRDDLTIRSVRDDSGKPVSIEASLHEFTFNFDVQLCREAAEYFKGAVNQYFTQATLPTKYGDVELYGYIDYWQLNRVIDLKTTSRYEFGKFAKAWQKSVYPYCLIASGAADAGDITEFEYTVAELKKPTSRTPVITAKWNKEVYSYDHERNVRNLTAFTERFIEWLEANREKITDKKIFNQQ